LVPIIRVSAGTGLRQSVAASASDIGRRAGASISTWTNDVTRVFRRSCQMSLFFRVAPTFVAAPWHQRGLIRKPLRTISLIPLHKVERHFLGEFAMVLRK
jgi:hypothetical protein